MPDFNLGGVGVHVGPDFSGFRAEANRELDVIERELKPVEIKLVADLMAGFRREAEAKAKEALADARAKIDLEPNIRGFKTETERLVKEAAAGINAEIRVTPRLAKDFKAVLRAELDKATKASPAEVTVRPELSKNFARELSAEVKKATEKTRVVVQVAPSLTSDFRSRLKVLVKEATKDAVTVNVTVDPENVEDIRRKLKAAVLEASRGLVVRVEVIPEVGKFRERLRAETGKLSVASRPRVSVGADTSPFMRQLRGALAKAKAFAYVPVRVAVQGGTKALSALHSVLGGIWSTTKKLAIGFGLLGVAVGAVGAAGLKQSADLELQRKSFQILLQSQEKGSKVFAGLLAQAKTNPFEVPDLTPIARQLIVIRSTLGDKAFSLNRVLPSVKIVTDLGAALGATGPQMQKVGLALGKIAGRGKLTSEELRSLSKNLPGFSAIKAVADGLGITIPEAFDKVREGAVPAGQAIDLILKGMKDFPGAAGAAVKQASETFKGALSNFPDIVRISFFGAFEKYLPRLTKIIGPDGPLIHSIEGVLPAVAAAFTPLAENLLGTFQALTPAISMLILGVLPVITSVVRAAGALAPVFETAFKIIAPLLKPIADQLFRVAQIVAVVLVKALNAAKPEFKLLGVAVQGFLQAFAQVAVVLGPVIPLIVGIAATVVSTIGKSALPVAKAFADAFETLAPVIGQVVRTIGLLFRAAAPLVPVLAKVVAAIGEGLVKAIGQADLDSLATALGDLAGAAGQIIVALEPLIPVAVQVVTILAKELTPVLEVMAPVITAVVVAISPLLVMLARMAPLLLVVFATAKIDAWARSMQTAIARASAIGAPGPGGIGGKIFSGFQRIDWEGIKTKMMAGAAVASAGVAGVFAGMADDVGTSVSSIAASLASIGTAWAVGGPIAGAVAAGTAVIGFAIGKIVSKSKEAKKAQEDYRKEVLGLRDAFQEAGVDKFSTTQAKATIVAKEYLKILKGTGKQAETAKGAFNEFGADFSVVMLAVARGKDGTKALNAEIDRASTALSQNIALKSAAGISDFGRNTEIAKNALVGPQGLVAATFDYTNAQAVMTQMTQDGDLSVQGMIRSAHKLGLEVGSLKDVTSQYAVILQNDLNTSPTANWLRSVPGVVQNALLEQKRLADVQSFVANETDRGKGAANRFSAAYDEVNGSVSRATSAYGDWVAGLSGADVPLADVKLGLLDFAQQLHDLPLDADTSPYVKSQKQIQLVAEAQDEASKALGRFVDESGGHFDVFTSKAKGLRNELILGLAQSLKISGDDAAALVDQILKIPNEKEFKVLAETSDAVTGISDVQKRITDYILSNIDNKVLLDSADAENKQKILSKFIEDYGKAHPQAVAGLNIDDATVKKSLVEGMLRDLNLLTAEPKVIITISELVKEGAKRPGQINAERMDRHAKGALVTTPQVALIGEAGPELVLPLNDPARMAALLKQAGLSLPAQAAAGAGDNAGITVDWKVDNKGVDTWSKDTQSVFTATTSAIDSTLTSWQGSSQAMLDRWASRGTATFQTWQGSITSGFGGMLGQLQGMAGTGGTNVVSALRAALETGSGVVTTVVTGYGAKLAGALNPILSAVGGRTIPVPNAKAFREGGVNEATPRIVGDGAYEVHVFGERGTRGEAYIPFDPSLRSSSRSIAEETVRRLGGQARWFREGGVTGDTQGLNPVFMGRLENFAAAVGQPYNIGRGYASFAEQAVLYRKYLAGTGHLAAPPGRSMHNFGLASDGNHWAGKHPELFGIRYPLLSKGEPWHAEPNEARQWAKGMAPDGGSIPGLVPIPQVPMVPDRGELRRAAVAAMEHVRQVALDWAGKQSFAGVSGIGDLTAAGVPVLIARALGAIRAMESGGNYTARNPSSSASGAYQFLASTWAGFGGYPEAWLAPKGVQDAKALANVLSILNRYGSVLEAVPAAWYTGRYAGHGHLGYHPGGAGNSLTVQEYVDRWMAKYASLPGFENGGLSMREQVARISERNKPELILPLTKPSRVRELADQHGLTQFLLEREERRRNDRPHLTVTMTPPAAERPETYAASMRNRLAPLMGR